MLLEAILHTTDSEYCHGTSRGTLVIRLRAKRSDLQKVTLFLGDRMSTKSRVEVRAYPMSIAASDMLFDYFEAEINPDYPRVCYYFVLEDGKSSVYYFDSGFSTAFLFDRQKYFHLPYIRQEDIARVPEWFKRTVMYQIFPDSFATRKGGLDENVTEIELGDGVIVKNRLGGTLKGIRENIPYLADLGIGCIYLNPVFVANSYHKYDTLDYYDIDPCLGTREELIKLVAECHRAGIRVILDGVFNQTSYEHYAFRDVIRNGEKSKYKDWYYVYDYPVRAENPPNYECFGYYYQMPKLNTGNREVKEHIINAAVYWTSEADIDGWRLDVANEIDHAFWREFVSAVRAVKDDAVFIGEVWHNGASWLSGDQFHSLMNFNLMYAIWEYFGYRGINASEFDSRINALLMRYKRDPQLAQMNFLDNHDVMRFLSVAGNDTRRLRLAAIYLMTHAGVPSIYFGDEKGMSGSKEEEFRRAMQWEDDENSLEVYACYRKLIGIRKQYIDAMLGSYASVLTDVAQDIYVFARGGQWGSGWDIRKGSLLIALNNSEHAGKVSIPTSNFNANTKTNANSYNAVPDRLEYMDLLSGKKYMCCAGYMDVELEGVSGAIFTIV